MDSVWNEAERYAVQQMLSYTFVGSAETVKAEMQAFADETRVDEIMAAGMIYDHDVRVKSYKILSELQLQKNEVYIRS
jgi:alkanesulfonate monooxygenase SsuD/methylene tetrahydromethanopterin reductase-like flavin-dependent oxidoreductase (luciferase family)